MRNIKLTIEYDGTNYHGWQSQINASAIQDVIFLALKKLTGEEITLTGSSRTDVGVHALGQVANFKTGSTIPEDKFAYALNSALPRDIVIKKSEEVSLDFHARFSSKGKKYKYLVYNSTQPSALWRNRTLQFLRPLDILAMEKAAPAFLGEHDFSAFKSTGSDVKSNIRNITEFSLTKNEEIIQFEIAGNGFLYNMVRIIIGTMIEVGTGKIPVSEVEGIIQSCDRKRAGKTAAASGLYLVEVYY